MTAPIVSSFEPVALIGGGCLWKGDLEAVQARCGWLVAADGGARPVLAAGHLPDAVIGDFDSLTSRDLACLPPDRLHRIVEQDSTDFDKALRSITAPVVLAAGFLGGRLDHQLAVLNALVAPGRSACLLLGEGEVVFHLDRAVDLPLAAGETVSLFPMAQVRARSEGLEWPLDGLDLSPWGRVGTSNRATGPVRLVPEGPGLLCIVPRAALDAVIRAIARRPGAG